jgi:hypothetical protein
MPAILANICNKNDFYVGTFYAWETINKLLEVYARKWEDVRCEQKAYPSISAPPRHGRT